MFVAWIEQMDRLTAIDVFIEVAERGSVTAAAESLRMSRAMATRYLAEVERWLGVRLLHRTTRRVSLTGPGELALQRLRHLRMVGQDLQAELGSDDPRPHGQLRVTASVSFGQLHLARAVSDYVGRYPGTRIELLMVDRIVNLVEERIDLAVRISRQIDPALIARRLAPCRSLLCAAPAYLQARGTPRHAEDLASHNCLAHHYVGRDVWKLSREGRQVAVSVSGNITANDASLLLEAVRAGAGIAHLPAYQVNPLLESGELVRVLADHSLEPMSIHAVYTSRRQISPLLRSFVDFIAERFGGPAFAAYC